ncbi:MAG: vacuolar iron transporter 1-like [Pedosphaera sp.]|nr:vacuolar iron transporter 1-like [Pedosphaera sp.]
MLGLVNQSVKLTTFFQLPTSRPEKNLAFTLVPLLADSRLRRLEFNRLPAAPSITKKRMRTLYHTEAHFRGSNTVKDIVIGMADGLTVPFALAAGISGAITAAHIVVTAGAAEIAAGSIAMGLGGYLAARSEAEHYDSEKRREEQEIIEVPDEEAREVADIFISYGLSPEESAKVVDSLRQRPGAWCDFMMRFELGLEEPDPTRALKSAVTIAASYIVGGIIPLSPYIVFSHSTEALYVSVAMTLSALFLFGFIKGRFTGVSGIKSAIQTVLVGGIAAAVAFTLAKLIA